MPPHLMTLADLTVPQIVRVLKHSNALKRISQPWLLPQGQDVIGAKKLRMPSQSLFSKTIALLFSKRSSRTRLSAETAAVLLGGRALFLGREDIQLGVNETLRDSSRVIGGMCQGIFARVGEHEEIEVRNSLFFFSLFLITPIHRNLRNTVPSQFSMHSPPYGIRHKSLPTC
jgi:ornithine carbamoyltransferase